MNDFQELKASLERLSKKLNISDLRDHAARLKAQTMEDGFWDHKNSSQVAQELGDTENKIQQFENFESKIQDFQEFSELIENYPNTSDGIKDLSELANLNHQLVLAQTLSGKYDKAGALVSIHSGAGGDDAQDFAQMLLEMYNLYSQKSNYQATLVDTDYSASGIKHATLQISGPYAFGNLKAEHGVHRLVRLSPFNSGNTRETSFAMVDVIPVLDTSISLELNPDDLKVDTFKSSGPGGQSVNTTDSAVRVTHIPSGIQATSQNHRSQHQNKAAALDILKSKLIHQLEQEQAETISDIRGQKNTAAFGSQIRSYTLHPYKLVKDHRTKHESKNPEQVFSGDIQDFIDAFLIQ